MVFMGVADFNGKESLSLPALDDLAEIEAIGGGGDHCLNVCVQLNYGGTSFLSASTSPAIGSNWSTTRTAKASRGNRP